MKLGLIARVDNRGLGLQTLGFYRNLPVARTLVLTAGKDLTNGNPLSPFAQHPEWYDSGDVMHVEWNAGGETPTNTLKQFCDGLDVIFSAETFYWDDFPLIARELGARTVLQCNMEFFPYLSRTPPPLPDAVWLPSPWLADKYPDATVFPFPVDRSAIPFRLRTEAKTFLHVIGHRTQQDRNGTRTVMHAFRSVSPTKLIVRSQDPVTRIQLGTGVELDIRVDDIPNSADLYSEGDVLILPRRFGGQSLVLNEALASGLPVLMTDCSPQNSFLPQPMLIPAHPSGTLRTAVGPIRLYDCAPRSLAEKVQQLMRDPGLVERLSTQANELADSISWETLRPRYITELEKVAAG